MAELPPQELEEIRARHRERVTHYAWGDGRTCEDCKMDWPCEQAILLARIEELEKVGGAAAAVMLVWHEDRDLGGYGPKPMALREALDAAGEAPCHCGICRRRALGGEDG